MSENILAPVAVLMLLYTAKAGDILLDFVFFYPLFMSYVWMCGGLYFYFHWERHSPGPDVAPEFIDPPLVSILVPCFNESDNVRETIAGVAAQNYANIEIIAINDGSRDDTGEILNELPLLLDRQQRVNEAGAMVAGYLADGADPAPVMAALGRSLLREDRNFYTLQNVEAAFHQYSMMERTQIGAHLLIATARYLSAHSPTVRSQEQTYRIAMRLHRGEHLFEE